MIAIFETKVDAKSYADKVHEYLSDNCPGYNAEKWSEPEQSADGLLWMVKEPREENVKLWETPIDTEVEKSKAEITKPLPDSGTITEGKYYLYKGNILKCRQTHERTIHEPKNTPALFSFFRDNTDQLQWLPL